VSLIRRYRLALAVAVIANILDTVTFLPAVARVGIGAESNPVVRELYLAFGPLGPVALKAFAIVAVILALQWTIVRFRGMVWPPAFLAGALGLVGAYSNVAFGLLR
jgi:hypothetical protein